MAHVLQFFEMSNAAIGFQGEFKIRGSFGQPAAERGRLGKAVKGHIDFHRGEMLGVVGQPVPGG